MHPNPKQRYATAKTTIVTVKSTKAAAGLVQREQHVLATMDLQGPKAKVSARQAHKNVSPKNGAPVQEISFPAPKSVTTKTITAMAKRMKVAYSFLVVQLAAQAIEPAYWGNGASAQHQNLRRKHAITKTITAMVRQTKTSPKVAAAHVKLVRKSVSQENGETAQPESHNQRCVTVKTTIATAR